MALHACDTLTAALIATDWLQYDRPIVIDWLQYDRPIAID